MGCSGSKPEEDGAAGEVSLDIPDQPVNSGFHEGGEIYGEATLATKDSSDPATASGGVLSAYELTGVVSPKSGGVEVEIEGGKQKAFVRRSSGQSFKLATKEVHEMRAIESNSTPSAKYMAVDADVAQLQKSQGATRSVGSEFQGVAVRRGSVQMITSSGDSAVLNAQTKPKVVDDETEALGQLKEHVEQGKIKNAFGEFVDAKAKGNGLVYDAPTGAVANASSRDKFIVSEKQKGALAMAPVRSPPPGESTNETGLKRNEVAPDAQQSAAALAKAKERAKKSKYGKNETLPESMMNAEPTASFLVAEPVPVINKAGKTAIKDAHEEAAAAQKKAKFDAMKILGAAAKDSKHHAPSPKKEVQMDLNDVAAQQAARAEEEAEFDEQMAVRLAEQKTEREQKIEDEAKAAAAKAGEATRAKKIKDDMIALAAEKSAAAAAAAAKVAEDAKAAKGAARLAAAKAHQDKHGELGLNPELRGARQ